MQPKPEEELSKCRHDNLQYKGCGACCPDCGAWLDEDEWHEWQIDQKDAHIATLAQQNAELEAQLASLREAITGWDGYGWRNGKYIDDMGEYFAPYLSKAQEGE